MTVAFGGNVWPPQDLLKESSSEMNFAMQTLLSLFGKNKYRLGQLTNDSFFKAFLKGLCNAPKRHQVSSSPGTCPRSIF